MKIEKAQQIIDAVETSNTLLYAGVKLLLQTTLDNEETLNFGTSAGGDKDHEVHSVIQERAANSIKVYLEKVFEVESSVECHDEWVFLIVKTAL